MTASNGKKHDRSEDIYNKKANVARLLSYFIPYIPHIVLAIIVAFAINATVIIKPRILQRVIDDYLVPEIYDKTAINRLGFVYFGLILLGAALNYSQSILLNYVGQNIMHRLRTELFNKIQRMNMSFFDHFSSGRLLTRVTNDVEALNELFSGVLINLFRDTVMIIGLVWVMFSMDTTLAVVAICTVPVIAVIAVIYRKAARKNFIRMKQAVARINGFLAENITGMKIVQIFHREKQKFEEYNAIEKDYFDSSLREVILNSLGKPIVEVISNLGIAALVWVCAGDILSGSFEYGVLYTFISYVREFFQPINEIADKYTSLQSAVISSERIFEIMDIEDKVENLDTGIGCENLHGEIEFQNVWFAYEEGNWILKDVSFHIKPGETVAFVGATGSGKSTIISLITRFYDIQKGKILIDGVDIKEYRLTDLRRKIAVVLQDVFLFTGDIASNIRLNNDELTDEDVYKALKVACADGFVNSLPDGIKSEVKERGCTFSSGQRQLLSFARAVALNPAILILDEATAYIDTETEEMIQKSLENVIAGRTSILIAHRLSTIRKADRIYVIDDGRIVEEGDHETLMNLNGLYRSYVELSLSKGIEEK
ncbi:ABC transporter ATP-binding protein [Thermoclostridium stercorarium subsp. thermolacticum DSM 2910]|uniref:ABC transporter ATP-binding protein n=1 Tax=Thermoclostridium stercorarium subsp. thermolacticum DSM 2910 TaxID=1121336 RepID=A0A1B1YF17_THEST|nr:ABC transporter ATP-binding protein [Thermoclostridium stercorarium]ANW99358.1 ABC transporter ATP-binding protein [Thermoclostridium stercorarium subsp. thermolacticum DSM 2910]